MYALGHELAQTPARKFDLDHMRVLLSALDNPEKRFPSVLIAGTNGKGSTAATLASILQSAGFATGLYTSPHLVRINERIRINSAEIEDDEFASIHNTVDDVAESLVASGDLPWHPSFFEMMTAIAFEHFARKKIQIAILEVGMGGRLDATNVVEPLVSVITDISLDHQQFLGDTVAKIAAEKAGIIRHGGVVVTLPQQPEANDVIGNAIINMEATGISAVKYVPPVSPASANVSGQDASGHPVSRYPLQVMGEEITVETPLVGRHQLRNVALAIAAAEVLIKKGFAITPSAIAKGIRETRWPGRFQVRAATAVKPEYVFDVAHNPAGAWALRSSLSSAYDGRPLIFLFGAMRDKAVREIAEILFPLADHIIATQADNPRAASPDEIRAAASRISAEMEEAPNVSAALKRAETLALQNPESVIVVTGSIYVVGEAIQCLNIRI